MFKLSLVSAVALVVGQGVTVPGYCALLASKCFVPFGLNSSNCEAVMAQVPTGLEGDLWTNTIGCRQKFLDNALYNGTTRSCSFAGPSGGGRCGSVLENTCSVAVDHCNTLLAGHASLTPSYTTASDCVGNLSSLALQWGANQGASGGDENTLECRLYHATTAATTVGPAHCTHFPLSGAGQPCSGGAPASVDQLCDILEATCNGTNTQFASRVQCVAVSASYPTAGSDARNTSGHNLGCRNYHAQAAATLSATAHCKHAGPTGGGACGEPYEAWASILAAPAPNCNDPHVSSFTKMVSPAVLEAAVPSGLSATTQYSTTFDNVGNTQACRIYHLGVASNTPNHCSHGSVSGNNSCGSVVPNLCKFIGGICNFGTSTWQFASEAACLTALTPSATNVIPIGVAWATSGNSQECRFYHAAVAGSYIAGGANANATDATTQKQNHCSHVLANAVAGCSAPATPTAAKNAAPSISLVVSVAAAAFSVFAL